jgi:hypothetical protein
VDEGPAMSGTRTEPLAGETETQFYQRKFREQLRKSADLKTEIDDLKREVEKQTWMLDTFMRNRQRYMEIRGGYADIYALVKQDLADDYADTRCYCCGDENDSKDPETPCMNCRIANAENMMEDR